MPDTGDTAPIELLVAVDVGVRKFSAFDKKDLHTKQNHCK